MQTKSSTQEDEGSVAGINVARAVMAANAGIFTLSHHSAFSKVIAEPGLSASMVIMKSVKIIKNAIIKVVI